MASIRDLWYRTDPATGRKVPTKQHGCPKRWLVRYRDPTGRERGKAFERKSGRPPSAEAFRDEVATQVRTGDYIDPRAGRMLFRELADDWLEGRLVLEQTTAREAAIVRRLKRAFGECPIGELRPSMVRKWMTRRSAEGIAASTLSMELWQLGSILDLAVDDDLIRKSPLAKIKRPKVTRRPVMPWSLDTIRAIMADHADRVSPLPWLAAGAGLRQGEAFAIGLDDIDFARRELRVERQIIRVDGGRPVFGPPKYDSYGIVPLPVELADLLAAHVVEFPPVEVTLPWQSRDAKPGETRTVRLLCVSRLGTPIRAQDYNRHTWHAALRSAGVVPAGKATGFHMLRHCYASYLLAEGKAITVVQARLRHADLQVTVGTYAHLVPDAESDRMRDAIASLFRGYSTATPQGSGTQGS